MKEQNLIPPKLPDRILSWFVKGELLEEISGDLYEYYMELGSIPSWKKTIYYWFHMVNFLRPFAIKKLEGSYQLNNYGMFKNYFKVGIRNILKYKMFSFINVFGLAVAMSVCMLIILMLYDQKSYDQFHEKKDRVYRILGTPAKGSPPYATIPLPLSKTLKEDYPIIEEAIALRSGVGGDVSFNQKTVEMKGYFAPSSFFKIFSFPLIKGDQSTALDEPNSLIITKEKAYQLFNSENPIGKQVTFEDRGLHIMDIEDGSSPVDWGSYTVTGVMDLSSYKTHLKFDALVSSATLPALYKDSLLADVSEKWETYYTAFSFISLKEGTERAELDIALADLSKRKYADSEDYPDFTFSSQSLSKITPGILVNNEASFRLPEVAYYILSLLALIIMVMACLNYTNLSIARSLSRMKEIGVRKVTGATRKNLIFQFLTESVITVMIALIIASVMLFFTKEAFMGLWFNKYLNFDLSSSLPVYLIFVAFAFLIGIVAGTYPALFISKRQPIDALKTNSAPAGKWGMQKILNVSQFVVSLIFIVTSMVIYNQFKFYTEFEYDFQSENIVNIPLQGNDHEMLSNELSAVAGVITISACDYIPATGVTNITELTSPEEGADPFVFLKLNVDEDFMTNLELELLAGKGISSTDNSGKFIVINESSVEKLGYESPQEAIGNIWDKESGGSVQIVGVVKNFRASLLINGTEIRPLVLANDASTFNYLNVRISEGSPIGTIADIEQVWKKVDPIHEFKYEFFDNELSNTNLAIFDVVSIIGYISFLAIMIACLGMLGMATYSTERRMKEVGIRKVLGAAEMKIVLILSKSFLKLLTIAILIAAPLSYFINQFWLDNLPNRMDFGFGTVVIGSLLMLGLGLLTIGSQTIRAARQNPVESLKDE